MEAVQDLPVALTALFGILLVSAQIFEAYVLFYPVSFGDILSGLGRTEVRHKGLCLIAKFAFSTAHQWREAFCRLRRNIVKIFQDFVSRIYTP